MAIKVIAQRREVKLGKNPGKKFVMRPDLYILGTLAQKNSNKFGFSFAYSYLCSHDDGLDKTDIEQATGTGAPPRSAT